MYVWIDLEASPQEVWEELSDVASHVTWMQDAVELRFLTEQRTGVGTQFDCVTKVGPLQTTDRMTITSWLAPHTIGVNHVGMVSGAGELVIAPISPRVTRLMWQERLHFPVRFGGPVGALFARPLLRHIWQGSLRTLRTRVEARHHHARNKAGSHLDSDE